MKLNVEVEIDWIEEDGDIDSVVKSEIINQVTRSIKAQVLDKMKNKIEDRIAGIVDKSVEKQSNKLVQGFINKKFNITDRYGDVIESNVTLKHRIKKNLEEYWGNLVNSNGKTKDGYDRGPYKKRVEWYIDNQIKEHAKDFATTLTTDTENKIKQSMKKNLAETIGAKLVGELGLDKLLLEQKVEK